MAAAMAAARSTTAAGTSPASQRLQDLLVWDMRIASSRCFCSAVREEMPWTPMSSSAALTPIQAPAPATLCRERREGAAGREGKNGMHLRSEGLTSSFLLDHVAYDQAPTGEMDVNLHKSNVWCRRGSGACWMVLARVDSPPAGLNTCNVDMPNAETSTLAYLHRQDLFSPSSPKPKAVVFSDEYQCKENAAGYMQASLVTLHKINMTRKQSHINIDILILLVAAYHNWHEMIVAMKSVDCKKLNKKLLYMLLM